MLCITVSFGQTLVGMCHIVMVTRLLKARFNPYAVILLELGISSSWVHYHVHY
jgi:hypothetical protein